MSLSLTPISDAWSTLQTDKKKSVQKKSEKNKEKVQNVYQSPQMQTKILNELGMIQHNSIEEEEEQEKPIEHNMIVRQNSLNINLTNPDLINMFKPYSNDYIEMMIIKCLSDNTKGNDVSQDLVDLVENIYLMVSLLLVLVIIDIIFKFKKN